MRLSYRAPGHRPPRAGGNPVACGGRCWVPACAGKTKCQHRAYGAVIQFALQNNKAPMTEITIDAEKPNVALSTLAITLLKRVVYQDADNAVWGALIALQAQVRDFMSTLNLDLVLDEAEGYAFLRARPETDETVALKLPRLVTRRPLTFSVSLILALLRKKLAEFDAMGANDGSSQRLILSRDDMVEMVRIFLPESSNEAKLIDQIETHLNKIVEIGFLRKLKSASNTAVSYEVQRILKAFVDAQWLVDFDARLSTYQAQLALGNADE